MTTENIHDRGPIAEPTFTIEPSMIDVSKHFWDAFDNSETEVSARWIVRFMQEFGHWVPFSLVDLEEFYHRSRPATESFEFNRLVEPQWVFFIRRGRVLEGGGWVVRGEDGLYRVTEDFVARCAKSSPRKAA
jgi:hypothetical protein